MKTSITLAMSMAAALLALPASAAILTRTYDIAATFGSNAPMPTFTGSFTLTWDNAVTTTNSTVGLVVNSLNFPVGSQVGYSFNSGYLTIGGLENGAANQAQNTYDFTAVIQNPGMGTADLIMMSYVYGGNTSYAAQTRSLQVTNGAPAAVPEPSAWAMLIVGFGMIGSALRRQRRPAIRIA